MADFAEETNESEDAPAEPAPAEAPPAEHTARAAELIAKAEELKAAATELFKAKEYKKALTRYAKIRSYTWLPNGEAAQYGGGKSATKDYSAADVATITRLEHIACGNMAQCHFLLGDHRKALEFSAKVIGGGATREEQDHAPPNADLHVKALVRSSQASLKLNDLDASKEFITRALAMDAQNPGVRTAYKQLQVAFKAYNAERKKAMAGAFAKA
jgi:hypothetical protein